MSQHSLISASSSFTLVDGSVQPFGACLSENGCNFSVFAPDAEAVFICIYDQQECLLAQIELQQREQSSWFGCISNVGTEHLYGIRVQASSTQATHPQSSIHKLLVDPYAVSLNRALNWSASAYEGDSCAMIPKAHIVEKPQANMMPLAITPSSRVIYEAHVKGLTKLHPKVPEHLRGTYLGAAEDVVIAHLQNLGITSVQFLPLMSFMPEVFITQKGLTNYWGYNPLNFFAAEPRYAVKNAQLECKQMIQAYRDAGIEVILDVVFNHTCEGGQDGPVISFKGLCESHAYLQEQSDDSDLPVYVNYSGCGNTVQVSNTYMTTLLVDALRYWVSEMGVSGFRFDLASIIGREVFAFKNSATFFKILRQDPILKHALMLAEPWDLGPDGYQLGQFPDYWLEVNDKFRDTVRGFWRGDKGLKGEFATRFMGSRDVFPKNLRPMHASVNHVNYHDGFTLHDLVCYEDKHNLANLEDNCDGHNHNLSANYGVEGITDKPEINAIREQQKRNMFATLILSQGTPHILGGDELSKTQLGNNNAYCQDNELNWYNWQLNETKQQFLQFCQYLVQLRQSHSLLQYMNFNDDAFDNNNNIDAANWYKQDGSYKADSDWLNNEHHCFTLHIQGEGTTNTNQSFGTCHQEWLFCVNSSKEASQFKLPLKLNNKVWSCVLDTSLNDVLKSKERQILALFEVPAKALLIFKTS